MKKHEVLRTLSTIPYFADLDANTLELVAKATIHQRFTAGEIVFLEGDPCVGIYIVKDGWLRAVKISPAGREQVIRFVGPGDTFNEIGVLSGGVNLITVEALEQTELIIIQRDALLGLLDEHPKMARIIIQNLANRIIHAMDLIVDLSLRPVEGRLARFLLDQASGDDIYRKSWATQAAIAARIGTVPVVINRAFRSLVEANLIALERNRIHILDRVELEKIASASD